MKGNQVTVQGMVADVRPPTSEKAPYRVALYDGTAKVTVVYWKDLQAALGEKIRSGNTIRGKFTVSDFRGVLQLRIKNAGDVEAVVTSPATAK